MVTICLPESTLARVRKYAATVNQPVETVANKIINRWMDETGDFVVQEIKERRRKASKAPQKSSVKRRPEPSFVLVPTKPPERILSCR